MYPGAKSPNSPTVRTLRRNSASSPESSPWLRAIHAESSLWVRRWKFDEDCTWRVFLSERMHEISLRAPMSRSLGASRIRSRLLLARACLP